jgi:hypothetical protein
MLTLGPHFSNPVLHNAYLQYENVESLESGCWLVMLNHKD